MRGWLVTAVAAAPRLRLGLLLVVASCEAPEPNSEALVPSVDEAPAFARIIGRRSQDRPLEAHVPSQPADLSGSLALAQAVYS